MRAFARVGRLTRTAGQRDAELPADPARQPGPDLAVARDEGPSAGLNVLPGLVRAFPTGDRSASVSAQMPLEITTLHSADVDELGHGPALAGDRLAPFGTQLERLIDRRLNHLARLFERATLGLNLG